MIDPIVHLSYASYRGRQTTPHTIAYLGIPYAEPPAGPRRFRKPSPLDVDKISSQIPNAVFDATHYPPSAMQGAVVNGHQGTYVDVKEAGSEDCLKLDIYTPAQATPKDQWPVMVYIHGGGYVFGSPKNQPFDHWIDAHPNVVIVAVYYRLSILGFLSHPEFQTSKVADNNAGLYDQLEALRWVNRHISKFGGDPAQVTICGQSAGGASVQLLLTAFSGRKQELFHRAIVQSAYRTPIFSLNQKKAVFDEFMQYLHCPVQILDDQVEWLRSMNAAELIQAADMFAAKHDSVLWEWKPLVDGELITDHFSRLVQIGRFVDVPVLTGTTTHDGRLIAGGTSFRDAFMAEFPGVDERDVQEIAEFYTTRSLNSTDAVGDALNCSAGVFLAEHFTDTWLYRFNEPAGTGRLVEHSSDNYLLFNGVQIGADASVVFSGLTPNQQSFADETMALLVSFVRSGSPNTYKLDHTPTWPKYSRMERSRMVLQARRAEASHTNIGKTLGLLTGSCDVEILSSDEKARFDFWFAKVDKTQN